MHEKHKEWIEGRGISPELAAKFGIETGSKNGAIKITVPDLEAGKLINRKYRLTS